MFLDKNVKKIELAWEKILQSKNVLLISHLNPDVDALSSLSVLIEVLKDLNKDYIAFADGKKEDEYSFLPNEEEIIGDKQNLLKIISHRFNSGKEVGDDFFKFFDLAIIVDCGSMSRTSLKENIINVRDLMLDTAIIEFDHHVPVDNYADIEIRIPLSSTTEVLYNFIKINNIKINRSMANCLLAGILADTGNLLYPSVSSDTLDISSELMSLGAQFPKLLDNTWRNKSFIEMKLWGLALANLKINKKYNLAFSVLPWKDLENFKTDFGEWGSEIFGDIVGFISNLSEADMVLLIREDEPGKIKGSLRVGFSEKDIDCTELASIFGGGGHKKASGFMIEGHIKKNDDNNFKIV